jgi:hypothetical protein
MITTAPADAVRILRRDWRDGRADAIPPCCVLRYTLQAALTLDRSEQARTRGVRITELGCVYVPCGVRHQATLTHAEVELLLSRP